MRWIGALIVAVALVGAGAVRPARAAERDPGGAQLSVAKALDAKLAPRRLSEPAPDRRSSPLLVAIAPASSPHVRPPSALSPAPTAAAAVRPGHIHSPRSSRGPPR